MSCRDSDAETSSRRGDGSRLVERGEARLPDTEGNKYLVYTLNGVRKTLRTLSGGM